MKKKILLFTVLIAVIACIFAISISAETPSMYIEFGARFEGSDEYITVYTQNAESTSNPQINFATYKFYSDVDFTNEVDMSNVTGIDFSVCKTYVNGAEGKAPTRMKKPSSPYVKCTEVKWFTQAGAMDYAVPTSLFNGCSNLKSFDFGNAKTLSDNAFEGCGFETLVIPSTVTLLKSRTFAKNANLKSVKFEGPTELGGNAYAFYQCSALESVDLGNVPYIGKGTFNECKALTSIVIPSSVTEIRDAAFQNCTALNSVTYEGTPQVTTIGGGAFQNVPASNLTIPSSVTKITGQNAFRGSGITTVVIPAGCTFIDAYAFHSSKVTSVSFAPGFTGPFALNTGVFQSCSLLESVVLPEGITSIGQECFAGNIVTSFVLPDSVTSISSRVFSGCKKLTTFTISPTSNLTSIGSEAFKNTSITSFYFPTGLTSIGSGAFSYNENSSLAELVNFENCGITSIPDGLFRQCYGLKTIKFPYGITSINGSNLLSNCTVDTVILPQTLTTISNAISVKSIGKIIFAAPEGTELPANAPSTTVEYANYCETYFANVHIENENATFTFVDADGKPTDKKYVSALEVSCACSRGCGNKVILQTVPALFEILGTSSPEDGRAEITIGYIVNFDAITEYEKVTNTTLNYGVFAVAKDKIGDGDIFNANCEASDFVVNVAFEKNVYKSFELRISGFNTDAQKNAKIASGAYVFEKSENGTQITYLQNGNANENEKYYFVSYSELA